MVGCEAIESIHSTDGDVISGAQILPRIIETASSLGAAFNVYRASVKEAFEESAGVMAGLEMPQLLEVWQEIIASVEKTIDGHSDKGHFLNTFKDILNRESRCTDSQPSSIVDCLLRQRRGNH